MPLAGGRSLYADFGNDTMAVVEWLRGLFGILTVCLAFLFASTVNAAEVRTWTSTGGKHTTEAEFIKISGDGKTVTLKKTDGKETDVPLDKLFAPDQEYVAKQKEAKSKEQEKPRAVVPKPTLATSSTKTDSLPKQASAPSPASSLLRKKIDLVNVKDGGRVIVETKTRSRVYFTIWTSSKTGADLSMADTRSTKRLMRMLPVLLVTIPRSRGFFT